MEDAKTALETKIIQLKIVKDRTDGIINSNNRQKIERQQRALHELVSETDQCKGIVERLKIGAKEDLADIEQWNVEIEAKISEADNEVKRLKAWLDEAKRDENRRERDEELEYERKLFETRLQFQAELQAKKAPQFQQGSDDKNPGAHSGMEAKLPKLVISKFDGSFQDWPRFWGQYCETIEKTTMANITKFAYLRELLCVKVKKSIEALPFTSEGYNRAKSILEDKFGKKSEIVKAYAKEILELSVISGVNVKKIHEFSDRLAYCVQSLETMGKLEQVNGYVSMTLDKLPGIRGDLVRTDETWESWDFVKLCEALRLWTRRNPLDSQPKEKDSDATNRRKDGSSKFFNARGRDIKQSCVYCDNVAHKSGECTEFTTLDQRKQILAKKSLCFNCTHAGHRASYFHL